MALLGVARRLRERRPASFRAVHRSLAQGGVAGRASVFRNISTVQVGRPANVAVFLVVPGRGSTLLFPADSMQSGFVEAGSHLVETAFGRNALSDTSKLIRRPQDPTGSAGHAADVQRSAMARRTTTRPDVRLQSARLPADLRVARARCRTRSCRRESSGISIPIEDDDALNTVTKLIRQSTKQNGPWAAFATDFPP